MGFFDYDGGSSYTPMTDPVPVDAFGSVPPAPPEPSIWDRIVNGVAPLMKGVTGDGSMGVDNSDRPNLQMPQLGSPVRPPVFVGPQQAPATPQQAAQGDSDGYRDPMTGIQLPGYTGSAPQDAFGSIPGERTPIGNPPLPTAAPGQPQLPTGMDIAGDQPWLPSDTKMTQQNGMQVPVIGSANPASPIPPGAQPSSPQAAKPEEKNFLQRLITGSTTSKDDQEINRRMAALGAGLSNVHGNGKFASFARGYGTGIKGYQARNDKDIEQATEDFNNHMKMLLTGSSLEKNQAYIAMQNERMKWLSLGTKGNGGDSWRNTPYGRQITIDTQVETTYRKELDNLSRDNSMNYQQKQEKAIQLKKDREQERAEWYGRHGIDPKTGAAGFSAKNPIDTSKEIKAPFIPGKDLSEQSPQFQAEFKKNVPPGAAYRLPGDPPGTVRWNSPATATSPIQRAAARAAVTQRDEE